MKKTTRRINRIIEMQEEIEKAVSEGLLSQEVADNMTVKEMENYLGDTEVNAVNNLVEGNGLNEEEKMALGY